MYILYIALYILHIYFSIVVMTQIIKLHTHVVCSHFHINYNSIWNNQSPATKLWGTSVTQRELRWWCQSPRYQEAMWVSPWEVPPRKSLSHWICSWHPAYSKEGPLQKTAKCSQFQSQENKQTLSETGDAGDGSWHKASACPGVDTAAESLALEWLCCQPQITRALVGYTVNIWAVHCLHVLP